jgi:hypothetical protein
MQGMSMQLATARMLSKGVNSLVKRHVIRELVKLDAEVASKRTDDAHGKAVVKKPRIINKEAEINVITFPSKCNGQPLKLHVVFEGEITNVMGNRIESCFNGDLKEPLTKIVHPLGWKRIKVSGLLSEEKAGTKYRCTIEKA